MRMPTPYPPPKRRGSFFRKLIFLAVVAWLGSIVYRFQHLPTHLSGEGLTLNSKQSGGLGAIGNPYGKPGKMWQTGSNTSKTIPSSFPLIQAAASGDKDKVAKLLQGGEMAIDGRDSERRTALMYAAWNGYDAICGQLLAAGANYDLQDRDGNNAFDYAASRGLADTVKFLQGATHQPDEHHIIDYAMIMQAIFAGDVSHFTSAKGKLPGVNRLTPEGGSPLHIAAENGEIDLAEVLIARGAEVNLENRQGQTPLHWAAWNNQPKMLTLLIRKGSNPSKADAGGDTPLMLAALNNSREALQALLAQGADKGAINKQGKTAKMIAQDKGFSEAVELLK